MTRDVAKHNSAYFLWEFELERKAKCEIFIDELFDHFKLELKSEYKRGQDSILSRTCESCKHKYIVDSMTTECRDNDSPIDYLDLECFPEFSCNKWEQK